MLLIIQQNCSFVSSYITLWNNLPEHICKSNTLTAFKSQITNHCFTQNTLLIHNWLSVFICFTYSYNLNYDLFLNQLRLDTTCKKCQHDFSEKMSSIILCIARLIPMHVFYSFVQHAISILFKVLAPCYNRNTPSTGRRLFLTKFSFH